MLFSEPVIPVFHEMSWLEFVPYRRLLSLCVLSLTLTNLQLYLDASLALLLAMFLHRTFSVKLQYLPSREFPEIHVCLRTAVSLLKTWCELILDRGISPLSSLFLDSRCFHDTFDVDDVVKSTVNILNAASPSSLARPPRYAETI